MSLQRPILIRGGRVLDPGLGLDLPSGDVLIRNGLVSDVGSTLEVPMGAAILEANGCVVSPGWIDVHAHLYEYATTLGVSADANCLARGVTTAADAGTVQC